MNQELKQQTVEILQNPKTGVLVGASTTTVGVSALLAKAMTILAFTASVLGVILTAASLYFLIRKGVLELKILKQKAEAIDKEHASKGIKHRRASD